MLCETVHVVQGYEDDTVSTMSLSTPQMHDRSGDTMRDFHTTRYTKDPNDNLKNKIFILNNR